MTPRERAEQVQFVGKTPREIWDEIEGAIIAAVEAEREACAKIPQDFPELFDRKPGTGDIGKLAELIRARSNASSVPQAD